MMREDTIGGLDGMAGVMGVGELMGKSCYYTIKLTLKLVIMTLLSLLP